MYFVTIDVYTGALCSLIMVPLQTKRFRLQHVSASDITWIKDIMNREGKRTGTEIVPGPDNTLAFRWPP